MLQVFFCSKRSKPLYDIPVLPLGGNYDRRALASCITTGIRLSTAPQEKLKHRQMIRCGRCVHSSFAVLISHLDIGAATKKKLHHLDMPTASSLNYWDGGGFLVVGIRASF